MTADGRAIGARDEDEHHRRGGEQAPDDPRAPAGAEGTEDVRPEAWRDFRDSSDVEVAIYTGEGRAFCAGEDMKETLNRDRVRSGSSSIPAEMVPDDDEAG